MDNLLQETVSREAMLISGDNLSDAEKAEVMKLKDEITFDFESISLYGQAATKNITDFSSQILGTIKMHDSPETEKLIMNLINDLDNFNSSDIINEKPSFWKRLKKNEKMQKFVNRYKSVSAVIADTKSKLELAEHQLKKDIKTSEMHLELNKSYIAELDKYIIAGELRIDEEKENIARMRETMNASDILTGQQLVAKEADVGILEKRIHDLRIQRMIAIQTIPQIMLIKDGDITLVQKINDGINQAIPLWESQIVNCICALRQQSGAKVGKAVADITNSLLIQNADIIKSSAIAVARENERPIADLETLRHTNTMLIETFKGIREERDKGAAMRENGIKELSHLQTELNRAVMEAYGNTDTGGACYAELP